MKRKAVNSRFEEMDFENTVQVMRRGGLSSAYVERERESEAKRWGMLVGNAGGRLRIPEARDELERDMHDDIPF